MSKTILQINYNFGMTEQEFEQTVSPAAEPISCVPGHEWKIWLKNAENKIGGGVYLFTSQAAAENYLEGPIVGQLKSHPGFTGIDVKVFDVLEAQSIITRAPVFEIANSETFAARGSQIRNYFEGRYSRTEE